MQASNSINGCLWNDSYLRDPNPQDLLIGSLGKRKKPTQALFPTAKKVVSSINASCEEEVNLNLFFGECIKESRELFNQSLNFINEFSYLAEQTPLNTPEITYLPNFSNACYTLTEQAPLITSLAPETTYPSLSLIFDDFKLIDEKVIRKLPKIIRIIFSKRKYNSFYKRDINQIANRYMIDVELVKRIDKYARNVHTVFNLQKHGPSLEQTLAYILVSSAKSYKKIDRVFRFIIYDFNANINGSTIQYVPGHDLLKVLNQNYPERIEKICKKYNFSEEQWLMRAKKLYPKITIGVADESLV